MTQFDPGDLLRFWEYASKPLPVIVVGGGRWGRTWASVIASARGTTKGLTIVARSNPQAVREWVASRSDLNGLQVGSSLKEALLLNPRAVAAIIASRPRDHVRDGLEALEQKLHILVEKPLADGAGAGQLLINKAVQSQRLLALGTEFAFMPALHSCVPLIKDGDEDLRVDIFWRDPDGEIRHGAPKSRHDEIGFLVDLLPHAVSILRVFAPAANIQVKNASENRPSGKAELEIRGENGGRFILKCDLKSRRRLRKITVRRGKDKMEVDFTREPPSVSFNKRYQAMDPRLSAMSSTLRLEFGAFLMEALGDHGPTPISACVENMLLLQAAVENCLLADGMQRMAEHS